MDFKKFINDWLMPIAIITICIFIILSLRNCNEEKHVSPEEIQHQKSIDSLNVLFKNSEIKIEKYESDQKQLNADFLIAQNKIQVAETRYFALKNKKTPPVYVESVSDCNDTIQSIYNYAITKDSLCNDVIVGKNEVIRVQDTIIKKSDSLSNELKYSLVLKNGEVQIKDHIIKVKNKEVKIEKRTKNIYKIGLIASLIKIIFFK